MFFSWTLRKESNMEAFWSDGPAADVSTDKPPGQDTVKGVP